MRTIHLDSPARLTFGCGCVEECRGYLAERGVSRAILVTASPIRPLTAGLTNAAPGIEWSVYDKIDGEPTISAFEEALAFARSRSPDIVVAVGGGSVIDTAKLIAALLDGRQDVREVFGIGLLKGRSTGLVCLPTTSGTGAEVSPNAIVLDETDELKKAVVSPYLVPDAAFVDPELTITMPPSVTASTGLDALTHCIEAYTNRFAHPAVDIYALEGVRQIATSLEPAWLNGGDLGAREKMALGSMYGGLCLGPVNTAAVHALAYPLGGRFHIAHGLSNALLLPDVMEFNLVASPERYAAVAVAMGAAAGSDATQTARRGVEVVRELAGRVGVPAGLGAIGIPKEAIPDMAAAGVGVTRLMKNNPREMSVEEAETIYRKAYA